MSCNPGKTEAQPSDFARSVGRGLRKAAKAARDEARRHGTMLYGSENGRVVARSPWEGAIVGWVVFNPQTRAYSGGLIDASKATCRSSRIGDVKKSIRDAARRLRSKSPNIDQFVQLVPIDLRS